MRLAISTDLVAYDETVTAAPAKAGDAPLARNVPGYIELSIFDELEDVKADWRAFERHADCTVFQTFDWLDTWQRHIGTRHGVRPAIVVGHSEDGEIKFILPLATSSSGFARELVWLGSDLCDYNGPLLAENFSLLFDKFQFNKLWLRITERLQSRPHLAYDLIRLEKMPAKIGSQRNPLLMLGVRRNPSGAYSTPIAGPWERFYAAKRSSSTRSRDRSKRKRLAEFGELALVHPEGKSDALASFNTLTQQKARSFARMGVTNIFARPYYRKFYEALITDPRTRHIAHISRLDCGSQTAAVNLGLTFRDRYYHLQASHDDGALSRLGPGAAHLHELLKYAIERGFKFFDFTIGDERYKSDWCDNAEDLYDHVSFNNWRGACLCAPLFVKDWLKRWIKQSPSLWKAFSRARALYAAFSQRLKARSG